MNRRLPVYAYVIFALIGIGLLSEFVTRPGAMIIPVAVFGVIFLLYKFPPSRWKKRKYTPSARFAKAKEKRKPAPFRVIQGSKQDDDPPKYH